ncbi:MAG: hypothetical protein LAN63_18840 [Acidobacteriia bacterium]|nr:hypothetical protein [Terriglobia bacterium]
MRDPVGVQVADRTLLDAIVATAERRQGSVLIYEKPTAGEVAEWLKAAVC